MVDRELTSTSAFGIHRRSHISCVQNARRLTTARVSFYAARCLRGGREFSHARRSSSVTMVRRPILRAFNWPSRIALMIDVLPMPVFPGIDSTLCAKTCSRGSCAVAIMRDFSNGHWFSQRQLETLRTLLSAVEMFNCFESFRHDETISRQRAGARHPRTSSPAS